jgi:hypothetical protein
MDPDTDVEHRLSLYRTSPPGWLASDKLTISDGVCVDPGDTGEIDVKLMVGVVVSTASCLLALRLPAAPGDGNIKEAALPELSWIAAPAVKALVDA